MAALGLGLIGQHRWVVIYNLAWAMVNWLGSKFGLGLVNSHWNASFATPQQWW